MKKVGLVGEAPNDTTALINLLFPIYKESIHFVTLINDIHGSQLEWQKTKRLLRREFETQKPDIIVFIRDLDSLETDWEALNKRKEYFTNFNSVVNKKGIFLLNIYELEALILSDMNTFNCLYKSSIAFNQDPMLQAEPKEFLITNTSHPNKYTDSDNPSIFAKLSFEQLKSCRYFSKFILDFETMIH
jgi:hypothetical protein